jgi:hypothetical protein
VSLETWQTDANGCSVRARRITSLESSREECCSEKLVGGFGEKNWRCEGNASLSYRPLYRIQVSLQDRCRSSSSRGPSWRDTGQLISGPSYFEYSPPCCNVQFPRKESLEVSIVTPLTFGFSHLASSSRCS